MRWCSHKLNMQYAKELNLLKNKLGEESPNHKHTKSQIKLVIEMLKEGKYTRKEISDKTGVSKNMIKDIADKKSWTCEIDNDDKFILKNGLIKFSKEQITEVIEMLKEGCYTIKEISDKTLVSKSVIRKIHEHKVYSYLTKNIKLSYKELLKRSTVDQVNKAIQMLETKEYTLDEIKDKTNLSKRTIKNIANHQRWGKLTEGKDLGFKK